MRAYGAIVRIRRDSRLDADLEIRTERLTRHTPLDLVTQESPRD